MKLVKPIYLSFAQGTSITTNSIHIPFGVKYARFVSCAYQAGTAQTTFVLIKSDIADGQPIAIVSQDTTYMTLGSQDVLIEYQVPKIIQGTFNYYLTNLDGTVGTATNNGDKCGFIVEFYDENSYPARDLVRQF